jgi:signal transduction histidine kinase
MEASLADLLRQLGEAASGREGIPVTVQVEGAAELPPDVQIAFYRITQEALNNVIKHARARQVTVQLCYGRTDQPAGQPAGWQMAGQAESAEAGLAVQLSICDDGRGFDSAQMPHNRLGLGIMQERAQAIGAALTVESQLGHGTRVTVRWQQARKKETQ